MHKVCILVPKRLAGLRIATFQDADIIGVSEKKKAW